MNKLIKEIDNCCDCENSYKESIITDDWFEHETGLYCGKKEDKSTNGWDKNGKHKCICSDEWNVRSYAKIPDWCPLLSK